MYEPEVGMHRALEAAPCTTLYADDVGVFFGWKIDRSLFRETCIHHFGFGCLGNLAIAEEVIPLNEGLLRSYFVARCWRDVDWRGRAL